MDNATHSLTGWMLARAGANRLTPGALPILLLAANAPDLDVISFAWGPLSYLQWHRGIAHSLVCAPVLAWLCVLAVRFGLRAAVKWRAALPIALVGVCSHLFLDWTNSYGIRLFAPFSGEWLRLDITNVFDVWIWAILLIGLAAPLLSSLVSGEIGARRDPHVGRGWAILALGLLTIYDVGRVIVHRRALETLDSRLYQNSVPLRVAAFPNAVDPLSWRGLAETREAVNLFPLNLARDFDPSTGMVLYKPDPSPATLAARRTPEFQTFLAFSQFPYWRVMPSGDPQGGYQVEVFDLRFGAPLTPGFLLGGAFDRNLRLQSSRFRFGMPRSR